MMEKITPWDAADFLTTPDRIAEYLDAVFEDGDPATIAAAIGDVARAKGMSQVAKETGLAREALYRGLSDKGNPHLGTVLDVLKSFGLKLSVTPIGDPL